MTKPCAECGKKRKHMIFDWLSKQWFCAKDFKELLKDYRSTNKVHTQRSKA